VDGNSFCFAARWTSVRQTVSLDIVKLLSVFIFVFISGIGSPFLTLRFVISDTSVRQLVLSAGHYVMPVYNICKYWKLLVLLAFCFMADIWYTIGIPRLGKDRLEYNLRILTYSLWYFPELYNPFTHFGALHLPYWEMGKYNGSTRQLCETSTMPGCHFLH
jgi:hypothetical protein